MLTRLSVEKGGTLYAIETKEGYLITSATADQLNSGREFMKEYEDTFKSTHQMTGEPRRSYPPEPDRLRGRSLSLDQSGRQFRQRCPDIV